MNINMALKAAKAFTSKNAPTIMTILGVGGLISAGVLAFKNKDKLDDAVYATKRRIIEEQELQVMPHDMQLTVKDSVKPFVQTMWAPLVLTIGGSILIFGANGINLKRNAALALGYGMLERTVDNLEEEIRTNLGEEKAREIHANAAQKKYEAYEAKKPEHQGADQDDIEVVDPNGYLIFDAMFDKEFISTKEAIESARNEINSQVLALNDQTVNDFRELLGMRCDKSKALDYFGWKHPSQMKIDYISGEDRKGRPCLLMEYNFDVMHFDEPF